MRGVAFDLRADLAHFRRPDTTATQMTYPFISPTAAKGLVGAILGISDFVTADKVGIELLCPVRTVTQQMSMLGKDGGTTFSRPTTIELVVQPHYRIYYTGEQHTEQLIDFLEQGRSVFGTYLGVAYALARPVLHRCYNAVSYYIGREAAIETTSVVPTALVQKLELRATNQFSRAGGFMLEYLGERSFGQTVDFLFDRGQQPVCFVPRPADKIDVRIAKFDERYVCLV
jgi:CRISPR-associated protein Cas5h